MALKPVVIGGALLLSVVAAGTCVVLMFALWQLGDMGDTRHKFTDVLGTKLSPDGKIKAASVVESRGFAAPTTFAITLSPLHGNPLDSEPVITAGEYRDEIWYQWSNATTLTIRLPCGWWGNLTNHYQLPNSNQIIDIDFLPPNGCKAAVNRITSSSSAIPN